VPVPVLSQLSRPRKRAQGDHRPQFERPARIGVRSSRTRSVEFIFREEVYKRDRDDLKA